MISARLVSVVIPNYNYGRYLEPTIQSVLSQSYSPVEVIVVDDGSSDNSEAILRGLEGRIRWFRQNNQGVSAARNRGISESTGEFVAFLDADDLWYPEKLSRQMPFFEDRQVGLVYCGTQYIDSEGRPLAEQFATSEGDFLKRHALMKPTVLAGGSSAVLRRECFEKVGNFDRRLSTSADWDMWRRVGCQFRVAKVPEPLIGYRLHSTAMHKNVGLFERDMLHAFSEMFQDPAARSVFPLRRRAYAELYSVLCGAYSRIGRWDKTLAFAVRSLLERPDRLCLRLLGLPIRRLRRLVSPRAAASDLY